MGKGTSSSQTRSFFSRKALIGVGIALFIVAISGVLFMRSSSPETQPVASIREFPVLGLGDHVIGELTAPIKMFVYTDLDCSYCKNFHEITLPSLLKTYGNELLVIYREFPLASHPRAYHEAEAAECAYTQGGNDAFWNFIDSMFSVMPADGNYHPTILLDTARTIGLKTDIFESCLETGQEKGKVDNDIVEGTIVGVHQVPSFLFKRGGKKVFVSGNYPAQMKAAIKYLLAQ